MNWDYEEPPQDNATDLARSDFWPRIWRPLVHIWWRLMVWLLFRYQVTGRERLPRKGPFIIVANHSGHADAPALMAGVPLHKVNTTHALAAKDYFWGKRWKGGLVHAMVNALPIDRTLPADEALTDAKRLLEMGRGLIIFPEGTRSKDGTMGRFRQGIGHLVAGTSIPVIPAAILGARDILPKGSVLPKRGRIQVHFGSPMTFEPMSDDQDGWRQVASGLESAVRSMIDHPDHDDSAVVGRIESWATSPAARARTPFFWGLAEASFFVIIPDLVIGFAAIWNLRNGLRASMWAVLGALIGGTAVFLAPHAWQSFFPHLPGITPAMMDEVSQRFAVDGWWAMVVAPAGGLPYKLFAAEAGVIGHNVVMLWLATVMARSWRFLLVALVAGAIGWLAAGTLRRHPVRWTLVYVGFWVLVYIQYYISIAATYGL